MPLFRTLGWVIKKIPFRESSEIDVVFTRKRGKVSIVAKGSRRPTSRLRAGLELFTLSQFVLYEKEGKELLYVREANPLKKWEIFRKKRERLEVVSQFALTLHKTLPETVLFPSIFNDINTLLPLLAVSDLKKTKNLYFAFLLRLFKALGHRVVLERCAKCGKTEDLIYFSPEEGGTLCRDCSKNAETYPIAQDKRSLFIALGERPLNEVPKLALISKGAERLLYAFAFAQLEVQLPPWPTPGEEEVI